MIEKIRVFYKDKRPEYLYSGDDKKDVIAYLLGGSDNIEDLLEEIVVKAGWPTTNHPHGIPNPFFKENNTEENM